MQLVWGRAGTWGWSFGFSEVSGLHLRGAGGQVLPHWPLGTSLLWAPKEQSGPLMKGKLQMDTVETACCLEALNHL